MLELLIGLVVTFAVGYFIVKGYKPAGILLTAGIFATHFNRYLGTQSPTWTDGINR